MVKQASLGKEGKGISVKKVEFFSEPSSFFFDRFVGFGTVVFIVFNTNSSSL